MKVMGYSPFYRLKWDYRSGDFEPIIKFKCKYKEDAEKLMKKLDEFKPYISRDKSFGEVSYTVYINRQYEIFRFGETINWEDHREEQQKRLKMIKDFLKTRYSEVGMVARASD